MAIINKYFSLIKFSHTLFSLPFALIGFFIAFSQNDIDFEWNLLIFVLLCVFFARNTAMAFNRYSDRTFDKQNHRTLNREIPSGKIKPNSVLIFIIINGIAFIISTYFINSLCFYLSPLALIVILGYSYTKRFTSMSHLFLGIALALSPLGAYLAVYPAFDLIPILLAIAVLFWVAGFDIIYALQDINIDKKIGLHSIPVRFGIISSMYISVLFHLITLAGLFFVGNLLGAGVYYWIGYISFTILIVVQHVKIKPNDLSKIDLAFFTINGMASVLYALMTIIDILI